VVVDLAVQVGSPEVLQMLYVLTCADLAAVGPGVLNDWKLDLITQVYQSALRQLTGDAISGDADEQGLSRRQELRAKVTQRDDLDWWHRQIDAFPHAYLFQGPPERILGELDRLRKVSRHEAVAWAQYLDDRRAVEFTIGTYEDITPGIFYRLTGVLTSQRLEILSAEIHTLAEGLVLDRFYVQDRDHAGPPPDDRLASVCGKLIDTLQHPSDKPPKFPSLWGAPSSRTRAAQAHRVPTLVRIDNNTADRFTIIDVFALDRMGLLYTITRQLFDLGLSVHKAKIGTHLDQVVDVFYVTDFQGHKIWDERRLDEIRTTLLATIEEFEAS
jgi:[protein-PII] uridylyltransferase